jgi:hypothetical protein
MNLKDIRTALFSQTDWAPTQSEEAVKRVNEFINRAYNDVCLEAPFMFFESQVRFATQVDAVPTLENDTISVIVQDLTDPMEPNAANPWVFTQDVAIGTPGALVWQIDRSWDGRTLEIDVPDPDTGKIVSYRNKIRAVWKKQIFDTTEFYQLSVVTPWPYQKMGSGPFKYRIYSDKYYLPDDVVQVKSMRLWHENRNWPLDVVGQEEAEEYSFADSPRVVSHGLPRTIFRREHFQLPGPSVKPEAELSDNTQFFRWIGPEPAGTFEYVITYCWGKRDMQFRNPTMGYHLGYADSWENDQGPFEGTLDDLGRPVKSSQNRFREPLWESAPSPVSDQVIVPPMPDEAVPAPAVKITLPNIEYMQGFLTTGLQSYDSGAGPVLENFFRANQRESGWHVRIYRRRIAADFTTYNLLTNLGPTAVGRTDGGATITGLQKLDLPTAFFLLAEYRIDDINEGVFFDNGRIIPDYHRRLRDTHGYQAIKMYPYPDQRYEVDVRCVRRPPALIDDQDAPLVHAEAVDLIIHRALMFLYENMGNPQMAQLAKARYDENLLTLSKRYGDLRPPQVPVLRRFSRAKTFYGQRGHLKRWWTVKS